MATVKYAENSNHKIRYCIGLYHDWREHVLDYGDDVDDHILYSDIDTPSMLVKASLCYSLCRFVTKMVKKDDSNFPPNLVRGIIKTIQMYLNTKKLYWKLLAKDDKVFCDLYYVVDNVMKEVAEQSLGVVKHATPVSIEMEEVMWASGVLGEANPEQLRSTLLFMLGVNLCLCGGEEHKCLRRPGFNPQVVVGKDSKGHKCLIYTEDPVTKTRKGGMKTKQGHEPKQVYIYPNIDQSRCIFRFYEKYCDLLPIGGKDGNLYLYESKDISGNANVDGVWYKDACIGINPLHKTVRKLLEVAGYTKGNFRNHSLRSTCCTRLYDARNN